MSYHYHLTSISLSPSVVGLVINLTKQGTLYIELEEIKNGKS